MSSYKVRRVEQLVPVKLSRKLADTLERAKQDFPHDIEQVAWCIPDEEMAEIYGEHWRVVFNYADANPGGFFRLIDALRYGYYIDEPIKVEITSEHQEKIRKHYEARNHLGRYSEGFREALDLAGIKIIGVNE